MTTHTTQLQFPKETWQLVSDQARQCLLRREFCPEQSRIDSLRCVHYEDELDVSYGRQIWYFEASAVDPVDRRHMLYGALEMSIQYGLLVPSQAALFEHADHRQRFLQAATDTMRERVWEHASTRFWVRTATCGIIVVSLLWTMTLVNLMIK
jgi:hypothetical protein